MGTQLAIVKTSERKYETNGHDEIIIALGNELEALSHEYRRLSDVSSETSNETTKIYANSEHYRAYDKMQDICSTISALKASSLEAAAIQMRVIYNYSTLDSEELEDKMQALVFSVIGVLENHGGFDRNRWAGDFYLGTHDPFERIEA